MCVGDRHSCTAPAPGHASEHHRSQGLLKYKAAGPRLRPETTKTGLGRDSFVQLARPPLPLKYSQVTKLPLDIKPRMKTSIN